MKQKYFPKLKSYKKMNKLQSQKFSDDINLPFLYILKSQFVNLISIIHQSSRDIYPEIDNRNRSRRTRGITNFLFQVIGVE